MQKENRINRKDMKRTGVYIRTFTRSVAALMGVFTLVSCIDEDTSDCGQDYRISYRMNLRTNLTAELDAELTSEEERALKPLLQEHLAGVFAEYASDNDLSFFSPQGSLMRHEANEMDGASATYTLYLPIADYRHIALANTASEPQILSLQTDDALRYNLLWTPADTLESMHHALFSARKDIAANDFEHDIQVNLHMLNCASAVVVDRNGLHPQRVMGFVEGTASAFALNDSTYSFSTNTLVRACHVSGANHDVLYSVSLPSREPSVGSQAAKAPARLSAARDNASAETSALWHFHVIVQLGGKYTESVLHIPTPLRAAQFRLLKVKLLNDGRVTTDMPNVGISVKLDWKPGGQHDVDI